MSYPKGPDQFAIQSGLGVGSLHTYVRVLSRPRASPELTETVFTIARAVVELLELLALFIVEGEEIPLAASTRDEDMVRYSF